MTKQEPNSFLPYGRQLVEDDDIEAVTRVLRSDFLTTGPEVEKFENRFAEITGAEHAVACANGTAALHLCLLALGPQTSKTVVVPSVTFLATANAVRLAGGNVVFADVDANTGLMSPAHLEAAIERSSHPVTAAFVVHLGGQTADLDELSTVADKHGIPLLEDSCHALGTSFRTNAGTHRVGDCRFSTASSFSLHPVKTIAAGEGGVVTTNDSALAQHIRLLRSHGMTRDQGDFQNGTLAFASDGASNAWYYEMPEVGLNYRLSDIQAALARSQLAKLDRFAQQRRKITSRYDQALEKLAHVIKPVPRSNYCDPVLHIYQVLIDFEQLSIDRNTLMTKLRNDGIGTQVHYIPVHLQPYYANQGSRLELPGAERFYARTLSLPLFASMCPADVDRVADALERHLR